MFTYILLFHSFFSIIYAISQHPILIVVSFDAFRYDFIDPNITPTMYRLQQNGTHTDYMVNVFPTKTFPNHNTISTGLYPENHGVLANIYYDPDYKKVLGYGYEMYHSDNNVIPIWRWNEDQDKTRHSGSMMWPGGEFPYQNKNITYYTAFKAGYDWFQRVDTVISWILDPHAPANLVMLYFEEPDSTLHPFGPNSKQFQDILGRLDNITGYLESQLKKNHLSERVNVVQLSDHGILAANYSNYLNVSQYLTNGTYDTIGHCPTVAYFPHEGYENSVYNELKKGSEINGHFKVYKKSEYLSRWHYSENRRTPPLLVVSDYGYALDDGLEAAAYYAKQYNFTLNNSTQFGLHGYDYTVTEMRPYFMARGPKIKKQHKVNPFNTVDLFDLFCKILEIPPRANDGNTTIIEDILKIKNPPKYSVGTILIISVGGVAIALILIGLAVIFTLMMIKRQQSITTTAALNKRFPQTFQSNIEAQHLLEPEEA